MPQALARKAMSEEEYFQMLEKSIGKYEYWDGIAVSMAGAQPNHVSIEGNVFGELFQRLRGKECRPMGANQALKLAGSKGCVFPDVTVVCGNPEYIIRQGIGCLKNPALIVEVLSRSTASIDETDKLLAYTSIRSVREYLIVHSDRYAVKLYSRQSTDELWNVRLFERAENAVRLGSCGCSMTLGEIYAGVDLAGRTSSEL